MITGKTMKTFSAIERNADRFLTNVWEYEMYVLGNNDLTKYPSPAIMFRKFHLSVYEVKKHQSEQGIDIRLHQCVIIMDIIGKSLICSIGDVNENHRISDNRLDCGKVKSICGYANERDYENNRHTPIKGVQSGLVIECEKETIAIQIP